MLGKFRNKQNNPDALFRHDDEGEVQPSRAGGDAEDAEFRPIVEPVLEHDSAEPSVHGDATVEAQEDAHVNSDDVQSYDAPQEDVVEEPASEPKKSRFSSLLAKGRKKKNADSGEPPSAEQDPEQGLANRPVRLVIGYLPEVSKRDAFEYAQGVAEKYFDQPGIGYVNAFEHANGYLFEVQEGGNGKAYAPAIVDYFENEGEFEPARQDRVVIQTGHRKVQILRLREGMTSVVLAESSSAPVDDWLKPTKALVPLLNRRTMLLKAGAAVMMTGLIALLSTGMYFRVQQFEPFTPPASEKISTALLPRSQWQKLESVPANSYVKAIRFRNDKWEAPEIVTEAPPAPPPVVTAEMPPVNPATPVGGASAVPSAMPPSGPLPSGVLHAGLNRPATGLAAARSVAPAKP